MREFGFRDDGIKFPCKYFVYGPKESKARLRSEICKDYKQLGRNEVVVQCTESFVCK